MDLKDKTEDFTTVVEVTGLDQVFTPLFFLTLNVRQIRIVVVTSTIRNSSYLISNKPIYRPSEGG